MQFQLLKTAFRMSIIELIIFFKKYWGSASFLTLFTFWKYENVKTKCNESIQFINKYKAQIFQNSHHTLGKRIVNDVVFYDVSKPSTKNSDITFIRYLNFFTKNIWKRANKRSNQTIKTGIKLWYRKLIKNTKKPINYCFIQLYYRR